MGSRPDRLATLLDRWAHWVHARRWLVLALGLVVVTLGAVAASDAKRVLYGATVEVPGTPASRVALALRTEFANPWAEIAVVAAESPDLAPTDPAFRRWLEDAAAALRAAPEVAAVRSPLDGDARLADGRRAMLLVGLEAASVQDAEKVTPRLRAAIAPAGAAAAAADPGFRWATTGRGALASDLAAFGAADSARAEARVVPGTLLILVLAFGALVAAGMPLLTGVCATTAALGAIVGIGHFQPLSAMVQNVATMVGLAVGIDYSLLLVSRYREALARGLEGPAALAEALRTGGHAIVCSGATVIIGMAGLALTPALDTRSIGLGGAVVVAVGVLAALTILPAALAVLGPRIDSPRGLARRLRPVDTRRLWARWAAVVVRRPGLGAAAGLAALLALSAPLLGLSTAYASSRHIPAAKLEFHTGYDILARMGVKNASTPLQLVVRAERGPILDPANLAALRALSGRLHADPRVETVLSPVDLAPGLDYARLYKAWPMVLALAPDRFGPLVSRDRTAASFTVVARNAVDFEGMRVLAADVAAWTPPAGLRHEVGGQAAFYNDLHAGLVRSLPGVFAFVIGATFLALALAYRCWLVPLKATVLNLLSVGAGCGALVVMFQWGLGGWIIGLDAPTGGVPLPLLAMVFCVVFGLSMDYEVFLISRIKEAYDRTGDNAAATEEGLAATGGMITAAAMIMVAVFGGFAWAELTAVKMIGVGLGVAVLVDATLVRVLVAPALMRLAGEWNWHPGGRRAPAEPAAPPAAEAA